MHNPSTQIGSFPNYATRQWMERRWWIPSFIARFTLFTLWHEDPNVRGDDDSCGWFKRARHGDRSVLEKIVKRFESDWDRVFKSDSGKTYHCGYFYPENDGAGMPNMGVSAIALNLFFLAALEHLGSRRKASRFLQHHLYEILLFAENPTDSLRDSIIRKWGSDGAREERIRAMASCVYGWILRETRPWYRHPRWHIRHWRFQIHAWQWLRRGLFDRCCRCGRGFKFGHTAIGSWSGDAIWHEACDPVIKKDE